MEAEVTDVCSCKPGSYDNGWHEERCETCLEAERNVWRDMMQKFRDGKILRQLGSKRL